MKLLLENLPPSLRDQRETLGKCLEAMNRARPLRAVYLFGSHARGEAGPDSDVDLCLVAEGAEKQLEAAPFADSGSNYPGAVGRKESHRRSFLRNGFERGGPACH